MNAAAAKHLDDTLAQLPVIAILRGIRTGEALAIVDALYEAGIRVAEVPLNSPEPFDTIRLLVEHFGERMVLGGGTVVTVEQVAELAACGATLCVSPNTDPDVIRAALAHGMVPVPGFLSATEAFAAVAAGARHLKMFPSAGRAGDLSALRSVLPREVQLVGVGGVNALNGAELAAAGAGAFGIGSDLYKPGMGAEEVGVRARAMLPYFDRAWLGRKATLVCNPQAGVGESPVWQDGRLVWTDPPGRRLLRLEEGGVWRATALDESLYALAALPDGRLAANTAQGFCTVDPATGSLERGPGAALAPGMRLNDMAVDARGGLWAGAMHGGLLAGDGKLYYAADSRAIPREVASGLGVPNGMAFSSDGTTLYVIDTLARTLLAYRADVDAGSLSEPLIVSDFLGLPGKPDGLAAAPDDSLWVAMWGGGCVVQLAPDGALLQQVRVPAPHVSSLCFAPGGRLFVTTSRMRLGPRQLADAPGSGGLFLIEGAAMP
ncbi:2-dehydro-3-deoxy-6-phosphogalactonate aldolase [Massilia sp. 9I]|uniref:2-dehydro-3-deoxy-6-phosphogalactonate aldolase n=1 Tax=Massilia sp. 9I TaxID=2653152 RepID=UPI0012F44678|nr:2-dehydro-3-deoxy-6-phosphogalactonate aldolase [Massilia sp. 9I]VXC62017.1 2-dehydro-3-deoxyphosphogalactonate aldolase [Massilia sp. 9I]